MTATRDSTPIHYWRYRMKARGGLNARTARGEAAGALLRIGSGFACLQPWPELGDPTLEQCLADLLGARRWPMVRRALRCAEYDGVAREHGDSLFEELEIPRSHATLTTRDPEMVAEAVALGFTAVKCKFGRDLAKEAGFLSAQAAAHPELRWRLDFNESVEAAAVTGFLESLPAAVLRSIDFLEDPCPYSAPVWEQLHRKHRVALALDRESGPQQSAAQVMVLKPALDEPLLLGEAAVARGMSLVVTSYMDHPVGQAFAAWEAGRLALTLPGCVGMCGLQTHHLFEEYLFSEAFGAWSPEFRPPEGTGLGFDELLSVLPWKRLG